MRCLMVKLPHECGIQPVPYYRLDCFVERAWTSFYSCFLHAGSGPVCYVASKCPVQRAYWGLYMTLGILLFVFGVTWMVLVVRALTKLRRSAYHRFKCASVSFPVL